MGFFFLQTLKFKVHIIFITPEDRNTILHSHVIKNKQGARRGLWDAVCYSWVKLNQISEWQKRAWGPLPGASSNTREAAVQAPLCMCRAEQLAIREGSGLTYAFKNYSGSYVSVLLISSASFTMCQEGEEQCPRDYGACRKQTILLYDALWICRFL